MSSQREWGGFLSPQMSCCNFVTTYQNAVTWHAPLYIKKKEVVTPPSCPNVSLIWIRFNTAFDLK